MQLSSREKLSRRSCFVCDSETSIPVRVGACGQEGRREGELCPPKSPLTPTEDLSSQRVEVDLEFPDFFP